MLFYLIACGYPCGEGTTLKDGICVASPSEETDTDQTDTAETGDSDTNVDDSDTLIDDSDTSQEDTATDSGNDSDTNVDSGDACEDATTTGKGGGPDTSMYTGTCAPPDSWTGGIDINIYTPSQFLPTYDAYMDDLFNYGSGFGGGSNNAPRLVVGATVVGIIPEQGRVYIADGTGTAPIITTDLNVQIGDQVSVAVTGFTGEDGTVTYTYPSLWTVHHSGMAVAVPELGADRIDYTIRHSSFFHAYGEITALSNYDCGNGFSCYIFEHDGVTDKIRVPANNAWGLDLDFQGGLCAEIVAPVGYRYDPDGEVHFLDVRIEDWMRVWSLP